ncbi:MAG TPA: hypothetical protein VMG55_15195 [Stellaceae bacterium]|nr:hypothetical protein [Stellaceae bacterium]
MAAFDPHFDPDSQSPTGDTGAASFWSRLLHRISDPPQVPERHRGAVYRIDRIADAHWTVTSPDGSAWRGFEDLSGAVAFIRQESANSAATIELRVDGVYAVAYLRPGEAQSLFGEAA